MNGGHRWDLRSSLFVFYLKADLVHRERRNKVLRVIVHQGRAGGRLATVPIQLNYLLCTCTIPYA